MDELTKFNNQTAGRDKVFRLVQYCSRIVWYTLDKRGSKGICVEKAKRLDETLGLMRRLLRFGRFYEGIHSTLPVMATINDRIIRITSALSRISSSCFMLLDHVVCLYKLGLLPKNSIDPGGWDKTSTKFWLYSIILGLIRDFYEIQKVYKDYQRRARQKKGRGYHHHHYEDSHNEGPVIVGSLSLPFKCVIQAKIMSKYVTNHADIAIDTLKNTCDLFIPLNSLGFVKLSPGSIGLLGVISTIASAVPQFNPMCKLVPAT